MRDFNAFLDHVAEHNGMTLPAWSYALMDLLHGEGAGPPTIGLVPQAVKWPALEEIRAAKALAARMTPIGWSVEAMSDLQAMIDHETALPRPGRALWWSICHWLHPFPQPRPAATSALAYLEVIA